MQCVMRPLDIQVLLLVCMNYRNVHSNDLCKSRDCHVFDWLSWSVCVGNCGSQSQYRERHMCCDDYVWPYDLEHCLKHCNLDSDFELNDTQDCRICENGGTLNILSCTCDVHHQGDCCQGKRRIFQWKFYDIKILFFDWMLYTYHFITDTIRYI